MRTAPNGPPAGRTIASTHWTGSEISLRLDLWLSARFQTVFTCRSLKMAWLPASASRINTAGFGVTRVHPQVSEDKRKSFCFNDGPDLELIRSEAERTGSPVDRIIKVSVLNSFFDRENFSSSMPAGQSGGCPPDWRRRSESWFARSTAGGCCRFPMDAPVYGRTARGRTFVTPSLSLAG